MMFSLSSLNTGGCSAASPAGTFVSSISVAQISDLFLLTGRYSDYYTHRTTCDSGYTWPHYARCAAIVN